MHCTLFSKRHSSFKLEKFVILDQTKVYWNLCTLKQWPNYATFSNPLARLPRLPNLWHGSQTCDTAAKSVTRKPNLCHGYQICGTDTRPMSVSRLPNLWHGCHHLSYISHTCGTAAKFVAWKPDLWLSAA